MQPLLLGEDCPMRRQVKADRGRGSRDTLGGFYPIARLGQVCTRERARFNKTMDQVWMVWDVRNWAGARSDHTPSKCPQFCEQKIENQKINFKSCGQTLFYIIKYMIYFFSVKLGELRIEIQADFPLFSYFSRLRERGDKRGGCEMRGEGRRGEGL